MNNKDNQKPQRGFSEYFGYAGMYKPWTHTTRSDAEERQNKRQCVFCLTKVRDSVIGLRIFTDIAVKPDYYFHDKSPLTRALPICHDCYLEQVEEWRTELALWAGLEGYNAKRSAEIGFTFPSWFDRNYIGGLPRNPAGILGLPRSPAVPRDEWKFLDWLGRWIISLESSLDPDPWTATDQRVIVRMIVRRLLHQNAAPFLPGVLPAVPVGVHGQDSDSYTKPSSEPHYTPISRAKRRWLEESLQDRLGRPEWAMKLIRGVAAREFERRSICGIRDQNQRDEMLSALYICLCDRIEKYDEGQGSLRAYMEKGLTGAIKNYHVRDAHVWDGPPERKLEDECNYKSIHFDRETLRQKLRGALNRDRLNDPLGRPLMTTHKTWTDREIDAEMYRIGFVPRGKTDGEKKEIWRVPEYLRLKRNLVLGDYREGQEVSATDRTNKSGDTLGDLDRPDRKKYQARGRIDGYGGIKGDVFRNRLFEETKWYRDRPGPALRPCYRWIGLTKAQCKKVWVTDPDKPDEPPVLPPQWAALIEKRPRPNVRPSPVVWGYCRQVRSSADWKLITSYRGELE